MDIILIAAIDSNNAIGVDNKIPWHLPNDLKRFKEKTLNKAVLMGRRTALSLPFPLKDRLSLVLSSSNIPPPSKDQVLVKSLDEAMGVAKDSGYDELWILGGQGIYEMTIDMATRLEITHVHMKVPRADTNFPKIDSSIWIPSQVVTYPMDSKHECSYSFVTYEKKT